MSAIWHVIFKELRENLRDHRSLVTSLLIGPLLMPALIATVLTVSIHHGRTQSERPMRLWVAHVERAPRLIEFMRQYGIHIKSVKTSRKSAAGLVEKLHHGPLLYVPADFGTRLAAGRPASVRLYADESDSATVAKVRRLSGIIARYGGTVARLRLVARGLDPLLITPIVVHPIDISTPQSRSALALGMLSYVILLGMLMGGLHIAIDATAGERERGSLEPLLTVPVGRERLVYGKMLAACAMMSLTLILTVSAFAVLLRHVGLDQLGMSINLGPSVVAAIVLYCLPLIPLGAALMTLVASYTRSYREAQTYVPLVLLVPTLPLIFASMLGLRPSAALMTVPSLGQHFLIMSALRAQPLSTSYVTLSVGVTLALGAVLFYLTGRLYRREKLLG